MPRTASKTAKPASVARREARRRAKEGASRRTGRPANKAETVVFRAGKRFAAKRPDTRALLAESLTREANWLQLVEQMEDRVAKLEAERECLRTLYNRRGDEIVRMAGTVDLLTAQGYHVKGLYAALLQRYVGAKLDTQHFTLAQAQAFVDRETAALEASLETLKRNQEERADREQQASNGQSGWTAEYVATPVERL